VEAVRERGQERSDLTRKPQCITRVGKEAYPFKIAKKVFERRGRDPRHQGTQHSYPARREYRGAKKKWGKKGFSREEKRQCRVTVSSRMKRERE